MKTTKDFKVCSYYQEKYCIHSNAYRENGDPAVYKKVKKYKIVKSNTDITVRAGFLYEEDANNYIKNSLTTRGQLKLARSKKKLLIKNKKEYAVDIVKFEKKINKIDKKIDSLTKEL